MNMIIEYGEGERVNNFTVAEAIYEFCSHQTNDVDAEIVADMLLSQIRGENMKKWKEKNENDM